mgnify:CR=1 FL=1
MGSVIKWHTGTPDEEGEYLVTLRNGDVVFDEYFSYTDSDGNEDFLWRSCDDDDDIIAWCPLSKIEPYKPIEP